MPQLNPSPWFLIMLLMWATLMTIFMNKTMTILHPNQPTEVTSEMAHLLPWTWPWH